LERSLTVLLPVQDAQSTLAETVAEVLEVASDWTEQLELLIIDDGSTDATSEVAQELVRHYPQVRALRHSRPLGRDAAVRTGLARSQGEVVFVREPDSPVLQRLHGTSKPARPNYLGLSKRRLGEP
jgi:glycosyltransferase involved in cell wall biosynthesis